MGLCIKFCSNDNISNTFQSLKLISKVIDLLDNQSLTIRTVSDWLTLWLQVFLGYSGWAPLLQTTWNRKSGCSETKKGNFDSFINFSDKVRSDLPWWIKITNTSNTVTHGNPQVTIYSDASLTGWGGVVNSTSTGGQWSEDESKTTSITWRSWHVSSPWRHSAQMFKIVMWKLWLIKTTGISYMNSMGARSLSCSQITWELWVRCAQHGMWLSALHIPGKQNVLADKESREKRSDSEWKLTSQLFECIIPLWGSPSVDLFASRLNYQLTPFVSWTPDSEKMAMDVFSLNWKGQYFYAFPPFSLVKQRTE